MKSPDESRLTVECACGVAFAADSHDPDIIGCVNDHTRRCGGEVEWWLTVPPMAAPGKLHDEAARRSDTASLSLDSHHRKEETGDMQNRTAPAVFDPSKPMDENAAAGIFRMCEAIERLSMKLDVVASEVQTLRHAVIEAGNKKR